MSLVHCPECKKNNVSDSAEACPNCGFPIKKYFEKRKDKQYNEHSKKEKRELEDRERRKRIMLEEKERQEYEKLQPELEEKLNEIDEKTELDDKPTFLKTVFAGQACILSWLAIIILILCPILAKATKSDIFIFLFVLDMIFIPFWLYIGYGDYKSSLRLYEKQPSLDELKANKKATLRKEYKQIAHNLVVYGSREAPKPNLTNYSQTSNNIENTNNLKCPICGSTNVKRISDLSRTVSVATLGIASSKIGKQYECNKCKHKW